METGLTTAPAIRGPAAVACELLDNGFVHLRERHAGRRAAWTRAGEVFAAAAAHDAIGAGLPELEVVGEFTVPPLGALRRDFQPLHIDFGLPIGGSQAADVARFTALYIDRDHPATAAWTRVVPLRALLGRREWRDDVTLLERLRRYVASEAGSARAEGILGRLVEAADDTRALPSTADPEFLCGMEFASLSEERAHFAKHLLDLDAVERRVLLGPGELLVVDNLATAHGRVGVRRPEELHQLCAGYRQLDVDRQQVLLRRVLGAFGPART
jgi:hypothetical protein